MLPGKKYKPEDFIQILRKRLWLLLVPFAVVSAVTAVVARKLPDRYRSDALIMVMPQRVPEAYVRSATSTSLDDRLHTIQQQILSRTRLERIIQDFDLYADERREGIMEDVVQEMRDDIRVDIVKGDAFRISYIGDDRRTVMRVAERLTALFIEENTRSRADMAEGTNQFLEAQLEDARRRLAEHESKLEAYVREHSGQLPSQVASNVQVIQNTQMQIQALVDSSNRDRDRRLNIERQLTDAEAELKVAQQAASTTGDDDGTASTAQQLAQARTTLQALELRFKPGHPDLKLWQRRISELERKADAEALLSPVSPAAATSEPPAMAARLRKIRDLKAELDQIDRQIASREAEERRLRSAAAGYQAKVDVAPTRESEMAELTRDYATLQGLYTSLLQKKEDSKIAANLERRQIGEQFKILDSARVPERPFSPDRRRINLLGILAGLGLGVGMIALLEYRDATFKTDDELTTLTGLPVLAVVPAMTCEAERRTAVRRRLLVGLSLGSTVTVCLALVVYTFIR